MSTAAILKECESKNITLWVDEDRLHYRAPKGVLNDGLKKQLKAHKPELIKALSTELPADYFDKHVYAAITEFNSRGISIMDVPEMNRQRASKLDKVMTEAANQNDQEAFLKALGEWRQCFH
jgi:hypothetical protein